MCEDLGLLLRRLTTPHRCSWLQRTWPLRPSAGLQGGRGGWCSVIWCRTKVRVRAQLPCCKSFRASNDQPVEAATRVFRAVSRRDAGSAPNAPEQTVRAPSAHSLQDPRPDTADTPWVRPFRPSWRRPARWWHERQRRRPWCCVDWKVGVTHRQVMSERVL